MIGRCVALLLACIGIAQSAAASPLAVAGFTALPAPQRVTLTGKEFQIGPGWHIERDAGVAEKDVAIEAITEDLSSRHGLRLAVSAAAGPAIRLTVRAGAVAIGPAQDRDRIILADQAYRLELGEKGVRITANAPAGLFYGVETLVQLVKHRDGGRWLPEGEITDWPDLQLRMIYWDDAHHLEKFDALKRAIRQGAFFKLNGLAIKLEGHFQYRSAPALVEPQAISPEQFQELTDYGLRYHLQVIPYLDAPAHVAFILKHPEFAPLREFADSNYEMCVTNRATYKLLQGMFQDLLDANKGVDWFFLSTDEPYYIGGANDPHSSEAPRRRELGSPGKLLAEFLTKSAGYLHQRGRKVIIWGEPPLRPDDVPALPDYLVNGETLGPQFDVAFHARGIRQMFYTSVVGGENLFPDYFVRPATERLHPLENAQPRVSAALAKINAKPTRINADLEGMVIAGWGDMGVHPQCFAAGYATIGAAGWNPSGTESSAATADFYRLFYGPSARDMDRVYQLMSYQAQFWSDSWESAPSTHRKGIWGNSRGIFRPRHPAHDQILPLLPDLASEDLANDSHWARDNARRLDFAARSLVENDELLGLLRINLDRVEFNKDNLEVFVAIANLCRHNLQLLHELARMDSRLALAHREATAGHPAQAVAAVDAAIDAVEKIRRQRNEVLRDATNVWQKTWLPRVAEANGRKFLHELDDVKDHLPDRTIGMEYLVYREFNLPLGDWADRIALVRNRYAKAHQLPERKVRCDWNKTE